jgi:hypothetical protein
MARVRCTSAYGLFALANRTIIDAFTAPDITLAEPGAFAARARKAPKACALPLRYTPTMTVRG